MKDWFDGLEARERLTLIVGAVILGLVLAWVVLINPLYVSAGDQGTDVANLRQDVNRARQLRNDIQNLQKDGPRQKPDQSLLITLERTARDSGLQVDQSRPMDASTVRVTFDAAPFDSLVEWMGLLERQHGVHIDNASFDRLETPGMVDAQLTLKRPG